MSEGSPPPSLCIIRAAESYPKAQMEKEDEQLTVPFQELAGEAITYLGRTDDGILALSNYRIFLSKKSNGCETCVPLGLIESVQSRDLFHLLVYCKDASTVRCSFASAEQCSEWLRRIQLLIGVPESLESLFAFPFYSWTCDSSAHSFNTSNGSKEHSQDASQRLQRSVQYESDFKNEVIRLGFDLKGSWRISSANSEFKLCPSYPQKLLVPCCITDEMLHNVANFRGSRRLPAVVWRHQKSGAILARCSQPEVGWLGWRNYKDEQLLKALADACAFDRGEHARRHASSVAAQSIKDTKQDKDKDSSVGQTTSSGTSSPSLEDSSHEELALDEIRKILIVDARSYTSAVTNRARGGGCECIEYYPCAEIEFMNLGNIHAIRKSFHAVRQLCASTADDPNWLSQLEKTMWMQHLSGLLGAAMTVVHTIEKKGRPVVVHCSDGWDRTPQIVATAQLCLDPYYRTVEGFRVLVEREWLSFGHKFSDRSGNGPNSEEVNERCPVFLQWLDLVHQIHKQFPCSFEFSIEYLIKLAQHSLSCLFGTFLCNTLKERIENAVFDRTFSVWPFLAEPMYRNPLYKHESEQVLWASHNVRFLHFWSDVYLGSLGNKNGLDSPSINNERQAEQNGSMPKTRSSENLLKNELEPSNLSRRSSDPALAVDSNVADYLNSKSNSIFVVRPETKDPAAFNHTNSNSIETQAQPNGGEATSNGYALENGENDLEEEPELNGVAIGGAEAEVGEEKSSYAKTLRQIVASLDENEKDFNDFMSGTRKTKTKSNEGKQEATALPAPPPPLPQPDPEEQQQPQPEQPPQTGTDAVDQSKAGDEETQMRWDNAVESSTDTLIPNQEIRSTTQTDSSSSTKNSNHNQSYSNLPKVHVKPNSLRHLSKAANNGLSAEQESDESHHHHQPTPPTQLDLLQQNDTERNQVDANVMPPPPPPPPEIANQLRRNTLSSNSSRETGTLPPFKYRDNCSTPFFPTSSGLNSLPPTPLGLLPERNTQQISINCVDGLAHALSEQNIRLHQIVQEHKQREDLLLREIHGMRLALLHKACPSCNSVLSTNMEHENGLDIVENASTCSWEAVEERSGPSSYTASSLVQEKKAVLWVPDHAVSRCSNCQIEFWLGRRKHHCRSCGEIFCADCSEFWAPLPYEKLFNPVRLCGPCYATVTATHNKPDCLSSQQQQQQHPDDCLLQTTTATAIANITNKEITVKAAADLAHN